MTKSKYVYLDMQQIIMKIYTSTIVRKLYKGCVNQINFKPSPLFTLDMGLVYTGNKRTPEKGCLFFLLLSTVHVLLHACLTFFFIFKKY